MLLNLTMLYTEDPNQGSIRRDQRNLPHVCYRYLHSELIGGDHMVLIVTNHVAIMNAPGYNMLCIIIGSMLSAISNHYNDSAHISELFE